MDGGGSTGGEFIESCAEPKPKMITVNLGSLEHLFDEHDAPEYRKALADFYKFKLEFGGFSDLPGFEERFNSDIKGDDRDFYPEPTKKELVTKAAYNPNSTRLSGSVLIKQIEQGLEIFSGGSIMNLKYDNSDPLKPIHIIDNRYSRLSILKRDIRTSFDKIGLDNLGKRLIKIHIKKRKSSHFVYEFNTYLKTSHARS